MDKLDKETINRRYGLKRYAYSDTDSIGKMTVSNMYGSWITSLTLKERIRLCLKILLKRI